MRLLLPTLFASILAVHAQDFSDEPLSPAMLLKAKKGFAIPLKQPLLEQQAARLVTDRALVDTEYVVGPGDVFSVWLGEFKQFGVNAEGYLHLPDLAPILLDGKDLRTARALIKRELKKGYDTSKVHISLVMAKSFKVNVLGEVLNPGSKIVTGFSRVGEIILQSGGFSGNAIRDRVWIVHPAGDTTVANLQRYHLSHADADNPGLNIGDKVIVKPVDTAGPVALLRVNNEVAYYQVDGRYTLKQAISQISGYSLNEYLPRARVTGRGGAIRDLDPAMVAGYMPQDGDVIEIFKPSDVVFVGGAVARPSAYTYIPGYSAEDYLYLAGIMPYTEKESSFQVVREGAPMDAGAVATSGIRPGDLIRIDRSRFEASRDYLSIIASLTGIVLSAATLYYTVSTANKE